MASITLGHIRGNDGLFTYKDCIYLYRYCDFNIASAATINFSWVLKDAETESVIKNFYELFHYCKFYPQFYQL